jgi:hypothetical protein
MSYPYPYARGKKTYPILGYHEYVYNLTENDIEDNLDGVDGLAYIMSGGTENVTGADEPFLFKKEIKSPNAGYIYCKWFDIFDQYYDGITSGHYYILLPKNNLTYPEYTWCAAMGLGGLSWRRFTPTNPNVTHIIFEADNDFSYDGKTHQLIKMKGPYPDTKTLGMANWAFATEDYPQIKQDIR